MTTRPGSRCRPTPTGPRATSLSRSRPSRYPTPWTSTSRSSHWSPPPPATLNPARDKVRAALALGLLALLTVVIALGFVLMWHAPNGLPAGDGDLKSRTLFIQALLTPVASLFGAATGFYFGAGTRQQGSA